MDDLIMESHLPIVCSNTWLL